MKRQPETGGWRFRLPILYADNAPYSVFRLPQVLCNIMGSAPNSVFRLPTLFHHTIGSLKTASPSLAHAVAQNAALAFFQLQRSRFAQAQRQPNRQDVNHRQLQRARHHR